MTIDEAIKHCEEVATEKEDNARWKLTPTFQDECIQCAADHRQFAEWLRELKELREENKVLISECDRLIKEKGELLSKVSGGDVLRICQLEEQLEKAKRLLKAAMGDMNTLYEAGKDEGCIGIKFKWRFADEALKLIGDEPNGI